MTLKFFCLIFAFNSSFAVAASKYSCGGFFGGIETTSEIHVTKMQVSDEWQVSALVEANRARLDFKYTMGETVQVDLSLLPLYFNRMEIPFENINYGKFVNGTSVFHAETAGFYSHERAESLLQSLEEALNYVAATLSIEQPESLNETGDFENATVLETALENYAPNWTTSKARRRYEDLFKDIKQVLPDSFRVLLGHEIQFYRGDFTPDLKEVLFIQELYGVTSEKSVQVPEGFRDLFWKVYVGSATKSSFSNISLLFGLEKARVESFTVSSTEQREKQRGVPHTGPVYRLNLALAASVKIDEIPSEFIDTV